ncbi:TetR/AcrR family transcriptional regulator [Cytobacillus kochii]
MSKKKEQLLEKSEKLFDQHGFHTVGLKQIIKESNVALMTMYNHFASKEALILEVLRRREERYFDILENAISNQGNLAIRLAEAHINWLRINGSNGCMFLRAREEYSLEPSFNSEIVGFTEQHKRRLIDFFTSKGLNSNEALRLELLFEGATALAEVFAIETVATEFHHSVSSLFSE